MGWDGCGSTSVRSDSEYAVRRRQCNNMTATDDSLESSHGCQDSGSDAYSLVHMRGFAKIRLLWRLDIGRPVADTKGAEGSSLRKWARFLSGR